MNDQPHAGGAYAGFGGTVGRTFRSSEPWWPPQPTPPEGAPNVVLVLADDVGYSDFGCYGSEIPTPHIDGLAERGTRYANFHVTPMCSPTRAALLTGLNAHRAGVGFVTNADPGFPGYAGELPEGQPTMAERFRANGYSTFMVGKWHLTRESQLSQAADRRSWPLQKGFDEFYGFLEPLMNLHHPHRLYEGNSVVEVDTYPEGYFLTDDLTSRARRMIRGLRAADRHKPFFLYYAHGAAHAPLHARAEAIRAFSGAYDMGWDALRAQRFARQQALGIVPDGAVIPPRNPEPTESVEAWDSIPRRLRPLYARYMEVYAAMVGSIDDSVGALVTLLAELGELDNTIFIVTSDNGASREGGEQGSSHYWRGRLPEPGKKVQTEAHLEQDLQRIDEIGGPSTWPHYPRGWAMACNTPFRLYKTTTFAGGHQVPLVVSWPARLSGQGAIVRRQYVHVTDVLPTLVDLIGLEEAPVPAAIGEPDGASFAATLDDPDHATAHGPQYYECLGNRAYYEDGWEAVTFRVPGTPFSEEVWQLYHVAEDPSQVADLAADHPDLVARLRARWEDEAWRNRVLPLYEGDGIHQLIRPEWEERMVTPLTLRPDDHTTERYVSNKLIHGRSFRIVVDWAFTPGDSGIVVAHGGQESGYVLYVEDDALHFVENDCGALHRLGPVPLTSPSREVVIDVEAPGALRWTVTLTVDGRQVGRSEDFVQLSLYLPWEGIDIGLDRRSPVLWDLHQRHGAFPFSGGITAVSYLPGEPSPDSPEMVLARLRAMGTALE